MQVAQYLRVTGMKTQEASTKYDTCTTGEGQTRVEVGRSAGWARVCSWLQFPPYPCYARNCQLLQTFCKLPSQRQFSPRKYCLRPGGRRGKLVPASTSTCFSSLCYSRTTCAVPASTEQPFALWSPLPLTARLLGSAPDRWPSGKHHLLPAFLQL